MDIAGYLHDVRRLYDSGQTTEHSFRPALERLFASIDDGLTVINEPRRLTDDRAIGRSRWHGRFPHRER